jgi:putative phosphoribosyl transferase
VIGWSQRPLFRDRIEAGRLLAEHLERRLAVTGIAKDGAVVLGLPRGGVPVAAEVAKALGAALDVVVVRKLGVPAQPELAMGAIGEGDVRVLDQAIMRWAGVRPDDVRRVELRERAELTRRADAFRRGRQRVPIAGRTALVVDDGIATGATTRAACQVVRATGATSVILAVPVAPQSTLEELARLYDMTCCLATPEPFYAVGVWYDLFDQTTDDEVVQLLGAAGTGSDI